MIEIPGTLGLLEIHSLAGGTVLIAIHGAYELSRRAFVEKEEVKYWIAAFSAIPGSKGYALPLETSLCEVTASMDGYLVVCTDSDAPVKTIALFSNTQAGAISKQLQEIHSSRISLQ